PRWPGSTGEAGATDPEPERLIRRSAAEILFEDDGYLRCRRGCLAGDGLPARHRSPALPRSTATPRPPSASADSGEPNGMPTSAGVRPHHPTTSDGLCS